MLRVIAILAAAAAFPSGRVNAQASLGPWVSLFDGRSVSGWRGFCRKDFPTRCWVIEDGALKRIGNAPDADCGDIMTVGEYDNFELELDYKISAAGNSGIKYLVPERKPDGWDRVAMEYAIGELRREAKPGYEKEIAALTLEEFVCSPIGFEFQLIDDVSNEDAATGGSHITGALYDLLAPSARPSRRAGEYNHVRLVVRGRRIEHWINGVRVLAFERGSSKLEQAIERSKFRGMHGFGSISRGHILLQDHGSEIWFQNIRLRELRP